MPKRQKKTPKYTDAKPRNIPVLISMPKGIYDIKTIDGRTTEVEVDDINSFRPYGVKRVVRYEDDRGVREFDVPENINFIVLRESGIPLLSRIFC